MDTVTIKPEHAAMYAAHMTRYANMPFLTDSIGFITHEHTYPNGTTICCVEWLPLGMYPNNPATAINKDYLQEYDFNK